MADVRSTSKSTVAMGAKESKPNEPHTRPADDVANLTNGVTSNDVNANDDVVNKHQTEGKAIVQNGVNDSKASISDVTNVIQPTNEADTVGNACTANSTVTSPTGEQIKSEESHDVATNGSTTHVTKAETTDDVSKTDVNVSDADVAAAKERRVIEDRTDQLLTSWMSDATDELESRLEPPTLAKRFSISHFESDDVITRDDVDASGYDDEEQRRIKEQLAEEIDDMDYDVDDANVTSSRKSDVAKASGASGQVHRDVDIGDVSAAAMPDPSEVMAMLQGGGAEGASNLEPDPEESLGQEIYYSDDSDFDPQETVTTNDESKPTTTSTQQPKSTPSVETIGTTEPEMSQPKEKSTSDSAQSTKMHTTSSLEALEASLNLDRLSLKNRAKNPASSSLRSYDYLLSSKSNRSIGHYNELLKLQMDIGKVQRCMSEMQTQIRALSRTVDEMTEQAETDMGN